MKLIEVKDLYFKYDKDFVLQNISLDINDKDFLAIIGPNGGGKSTFLKLILGILKPTKGQIKLSTSNIQDVTHIGYVPQNTNINIDFPIKVIEIVVMGHVGKRKKLFGYSNEELSCAMNSLKQVGMEAFAQKRIGQLSGGQRQRVMIARALCANSKILLLDEPTASIDIKGQKQIYDLLKELNKIITVVVVTHDISIILEYATKVAHINRELTYHDIENENYNFNKTSEHFCEVEMLQLLTKTPRKSCKC